MINLIVNDSVKNEVMTEFHPYIEWCKGMFGFFNEAPGKEHYRLIANLAKQFPEDSVFVDIGTAEGHSAIALTANSSAKIVSYDLIDRFLTPETYGKKTIKNHPRIDFRVKNCMDVTQLDTLKNAKMIFLDVDPHDGKQEVQMIQMLLIIGFRGIVLCDDIHLNDGMRNWWNNSIPSSIKKVDLTKYGHWSGTGALIFDPSVVDIQVSN